MIPQTSRRTKLLALASAPALVALLLVSALPALAAATAAAGAGSLTIQPAAGNDLTSLNIVTSGPCPAGTNIIGRIFGKGFPADGQVVVSNSPITTYVPTKARGLILAVGLSLRDYVNQQENPVPLEGSYRFVVTCRMNATLGDLGQFVGSLTFDKTRRFVAREPNVPASSLVPDPPDPADQLPSRLAASAGSPASAASLRPTARQSLSSPARSSNEKRFATPLEIAGVLIVAVGLIVLIRQRRARRDRA